MKVSNIVFNKNEKCERYLPVGTVFLPVATIDYFDSIKVCFIDNHNEKKERYILATEEFADETYEYAATAMHTFFNTSSLGTVHIFYKKG